MKSSSLESITRKGAQFFVVTRTFMSDQTFQQGLCDRVAPDKLRFPGVLNQLPFSITLSLAARALLADLRDGETVYFTL
jgi:hypothetical protein